MRVIYVIVALGSIISLQTVIETIRRNKKQSKHPSDLILVMCIVESAFCFQSLISSPYITSGYISCYTALNYFVSTTSPFFYDKSDALIAIIAVNEFSTQYFQMAALIANFCLVSDLISTI